MKPTAARALARFPGYFAGKDGVIYSTHKSSRNPSGAMYPLNGGRNGSGYQHVALPNGKGYKVQMVHVLVLEAWCGPRPSGMVASHLDGDVDNNRPENLTWETHAKNLSRRHGHGTHDRGFNNSRASVSPDDVANIKRMRANGHTHRSIADAHGVSRTTVSRVLSGRRFQGGDA